jgi:tRNA pseudouridine55 synthase
MGVLVIDKSPGPTSFAVVRQVQRALATARGVAPRKLKVGHGGTLDPLASGVLPVCVGEATKLAPFLLDADKEYRATARLGVTTDTLDAQGRVMETRPVVGATAEAIEAALAGLRGPIEQTPPMYSALKRGGRPLHSYARAGETVERAARPVVVHELVLEEFTPPDEVRLRVRCSKGTYVRVLAADLGAALGVGAHLTALRRLASGPFHLAQALTVSAVQERLAAGAAVPFVGLAEALVHLPALAVTEAAGAAVRQGRRMGWGELGAAEPPVGQVRLLDERGGLVAVVGPAPDGGVRIARVFGRNADHDPEAVEPWAV